MDKEEGIYGPGKDFAYNSADLNPIPRNMVQDYCQHFTKMYSVGEVRDKGRKYILRTSDLGRKDRRKDGRTD